MSTRGRRRRFTRAQRDRVLALAAEGASQREIAEQVFGDVRYRGRVERILAAEATARLPRKRLETAPEVQRELHIRRLRCGPGVVLAGGLGGQV
jgi:hypothetical protein